MGHKPFLLQVFGGISICLFETYSMACCQAAGLHDNPYNGNVEISLLPSFDIDTPKPYNICGIYDTIASHPV
jgi:hypothetical protein